MSLKFTRQMRVRYSSSQSVKSVNSIFNFLHRLSPSSSPTNTRSQVTSRSTSEVAMIGLHDHTGSNTHSCVHSPIPAHRRTDMVSPTLLRWPSRTGQRSGSPTGCAVLEKTDREESEPDQPTPGGELLVGCSMRRQIACKQLGLLSIILIGPTFPFS